jgi:hypothetical protein
MSDEALPNSITELFDQIEKTRQPISSATIVEQIAALTRRINKPSARADAEIEAEWTVFALWPRNPENAYDWGTYFGPMMVGRGKDGEKVESPDIKNVSEAMVTHWLTRMRSAQHPVLKARYADAAWDVGRKLFGKLVPILAAQIAVDSYADIVTNGLEIYRNEKMKCLDRAMSIAISVNDFARVSLIANGSISLARSETESDASGVWGFCFDLLLDNPKLEILFPQENQIIDELEARLVSAVASTMTEQPQDPFVSKQATIRLAKYYFRNKKLKEVERVISQCIRHFLALYETVNGMQAHSWLEDILDLARQYNFREEVDHLTVLLQKTGRKVRDEMQLHSVKIELPAEKVDNWIASLLTGTHEEIIGKVSLAFVPGQKALEKQVKDLAAGAPLMAFVGIHRYGTDGQSIAYVGSVEQDLSGRVVLQASQNMEITTHFLHLALEGIFKRMDSRPEVFAAEIKKSPLFSDSHFGIISRGIAAHFAGDYMVSTHLLIPQIEECVRTHLKLHNRPIWKGNRVGGMDVLTLAKIIRDSSFESFFGSDVTRYMQILLTDSRGWNLRNQVCHGLLPSEGFLSAASDRALHVIMLLSLARPKNDSDSAS